MRAEILPFLSQKIFIRPVSTTKGSKKKKVFSSSDWLKFRLSRSLIGVEYYEQQMTSFPFLIKKCSLLDFFLYINRVCGVIYEYMFRIPCF